VLAGTIGLASGGVGLYYALKPAPAARVSPKVTLGAISEEINQMHSIFLIDCKEGKYQCNTRLIPDTRGVIARADLGLGGYKDHSVVLKWFLVRSGASALPDTLNATIVTATTQNEDPVTFGIFVPTPKHGGCYHLQVKLISEDRRVLRTRIARPFRVLQMRNEWVVRPAQRSNVDCN
jgi:hypothetical protein